jgi:hypothetical protein
MTPERIDRAQLDLFTLPPCACGFPADVVEDEGVRIGGWCMCPNDRVPMVFAETYAEAKGMWEEMMNGSPGLADASRQERKAA